jgi:cation diffusion facilitator CzcD-associated flavoprotein CzcO
MSVADVDTIVVGGGPAGLAAAAELRRRGVECLVLEQGEAVGSCWRRLYDSLTLHTGKLLSALPGLPFPRETPTFPNRDQLVDYLERYRERWHLPVRTRCSVERAWREGAWWRLEVDEHEGRGTFRCRALVAACGTISRPFVPALEGSDRFRGTLLHSVCYRNVEPFRGRRVLVVGSGNSGAEIATELARAGVAVDLAMRSGPRVMPRKVWGVPLQYLAWGLLRLPLPAATRRTVASAFAAVGERRRGASPLPRPPGGVLDTVPVLAAGFEEAIRAGRIRVRAALCGFEREHARFTDGDRARYDVVVLATGFRPALDFLPELSSQASVLNASSRREPESLPREQLHFVGYRQDATGTLHNIRRDARDAARAIALRAPA